MKKLDKKQIPQVILLVVLTCAVFGWFAYRLITPTPAAAHSPAADAATSVASTPATDGSGGAVDPAALPATVVPPGPDMRDPFVPTISSTPAPVPAPAPIAPASAVSAVKPIKVASLPPVVPVAPVLPFSAPPSRVPVTPAAPAVAPQPAAIPPPDWTVTGVLASGSEHVAILRSGEARRFVKKGDSVDGLFVVSAVTSESVILRHGSLHYILPLGGAKGAAPTAAPRPAAPAVRPAPASGDMTLAPTRPVRVAQALRVRPTPVIRRLAVKSAARNAMHHALCAASLYQAPLLTPPPAASLLPVGSLAPNFSLRTLGGETQSLSQHRGQVVLLHFWASWNPASQAGLPLLEQFCSAYSPQGLAVLSVNSWDNDASVRPFLRRQGMDVASVLYDPSVADESVAVRLYQAPDVSATYVINRDGKVAASFLGYSPQTLADIRRALASLGVS
jgi:thiol-disulfide isomerase/thioredoxin